MREAAVAALVALLQSADYHDRIDAGRALASFAADLRVEQELVRILADDEDTMVTRTTADALLRRHDSPGFAIVAAGLDRSDASHSDAIYDAAVEIFAISARERDNAIHIYSALRESSDNAVRRGAAQMVAVLAGINPLLRPHEK